jgi:hypothetical protein
MASGLTRGGIRFADKDILHKIPQPYRATPWLPPELAKPVAPDDEVRLSGRP